MALSHYFPPQGGGLLPRGELIQLPAVQRPVDLYLAGEADARSVARELLASRSARVWWRGRAGNRGSLAAAVARETGRTVYNVTPGPALAIDLGRETADAARDTDLHCYTVEDVDVRFPVGSVLTVNAALLVARMLRVSNDYPLAGAVVIVHEAHDVSAYTRTVRSLALALGAVCVAAVMPAEMVSEGCGPVVGPCVQVEHYDSSLPVAMWDPAVPGQPWSIDNVTRAMALYVDSIVQARRLAAVYRAAGIEAYHLYARGHPDVYRAARAALARSDGPRVVLLLDASFRGGLRLPVTEIVDAGDAVFYVHAGSWDGFCVRPVTAEEQVYALGTGGRCAGVVTRAYLPADEPGELPFDYDAAEVEATAYLYRCFGYRPDGHLAATVMATESLPIGVDPVDAFNGIDSLRTLCVGVAGQPVPGARWPVRDLPAIVSLPSVVADAAPAVVPAVAVSPLRDDACSVSACGVLSGLGAVADGVEEQVAAAALRVSELAQGFLADGSGGVADLPGDLVVADAVGDPLCEPEPRVADELLQLAQMPGLPAWLVGIPRDKLGTLLAAALGRHNWFARGAAAVVAVVAVERRVCSGGRSTSARRFCEAYALVRGARLAEARARYATLAGVLARVARLELVAVAVAPAVVRAHFHTMRRDIGFGCVGPGEPLVGRVGMAVWEAAGSSTLILGVVPDQEACMPDMDSRRVVEFRSPWTGFASVEYLQGHLVAASFGAFIAEFVGGKHCGLVPPVGGDGRVEDNG